MAENESGNSLMSFLLGTAAGIIAGLLWAPRPGEETRQRLSRWAEDMSEKGQDLINRGKEKGQELYSEGRYKAQEGAERVRQTVESGRNAFNDSQSS